MTTPLINTWSPERIARYRLIRAPEVGNRLLSRLFRKYDSIDAFLARTDAWRTEKLTDVQMASIRESMQKSVDADFEILEREHIRFILATDEDFPKELLPIPDAPIAIFCRGSLPTSHPRLAIVGTRKMTSYGGQCTRAFATALSRIGISIVSGLAFGVDMEAHQSALQAGMDGDTGHIAVLPGGIDDASIMPKTHLSLARETVDRGGCLISEHAPGSPTPPYQYLHRNRLIAGLSRAVLVIEADQRSGAITTAKLALEQGKDVLCVPGSIFSDVSRGTNQLLKDGAIPCTEIEDILSALSFESLDHATKLLSTKRSFSTTDEEDRLLALFTEPRSVDDLVHLEARSAREIHRLIATLEMKGYLICDDGDVYRRV